MPPKRHFGDVSPDDPGPAAEIAAAAAVEALPLAPLVSTDEDRLALLAAQRAALAAALRAGVADFQSALKDESVRVEAWAEAMIAELAAAQASAHDFARHEVHEADSAKTSLTHSMHELGRLLDGLAQVRHTLL